MPVCVDLAALARARRRELEAELARIVSRCRDLGYRKVILFGSLARGDVGPWSDIDLILVKETDRRFLDRLDEFYRAVLPKTAVDVLVYTPAEFAELLRSRRFVQQAVAEGVVLVDEEGVGGGGGEVAEAGGAAIVRLLFMTSLVVSTTLRAFGPSRPRKRR